MGFKAEATDNNNTENTSTKGIAVDVATIQLKMRPSSFENVEGKTKKLPYPKSIFFIVCKEFCEHFNYSASRTILYLYLTQKLLFDENSATAAYHSFITLTYFMGIFGAIISDSWLGKFKTLLYLSILNVLGSLVLSVGAIPYVGFSTRHIALYIGLLLVAIGRGGIKPCTTAFGGDQFKLPEQNIQMAAFYSIFYTSVNSAALFATTSTPILRKDVYCFGDYDCYSLAFGVPSILIVLVMMIFMLGKPLYKIAPPTGNMIVLVTKCVVTAISTKIREQKTKPRNHWLDYAKDKVSSQLIKDTKILLKILILYIPLPLFWALYHQQGSRWTFQASRMDGDMGFYMFKPDQMMFLNPSLFLLFTPLFGTVFYPLLSKVGIRRPLQKLSLAGILAGVSFLLSACVEFKLEKTYSLLPGPVETQLRIFNGLPCDYDATTSIPNVERFALNGLQAFEEKHIKVPGGGVNTTFIYTLNLSGDANSQCPNKIVGQVNLTEGTAQSIFVTGSSLDKKDFFIDHPDKSRTGNPLVRFLVAASVSRKLAVKNILNGNSDAFDGKTIHRELSNVLASTYDVFIDKNKIATLTLRQGGVYTVIVREDVITGLFEYTVFEIATPNSMSMLWLLPQFAVMSLADVMFSVTGLAFSYAQAPESMKSVIQACWFLNAAIGNLITTAITGLGFFSSQAYEFLLFAGLMFLDMLLFMVLAYCYKSVQQNSSSGNVTISNNIKHDNNKRNGCMAAKGK